MADLGNFFQGFSQIPGLLDSETVHTLIPDNKTASSIVEGFKQGQSGKYDYNRLLNEELPKVQEQIAKQSADAQGKADKLNQKMQRYSMIGNILNGIGALANTVNTAYMAAVHGKRAAQIGTPFSEFGSTLAKQGLGYGEEAREYEKLATKSPLEALGVLKTQADIGNMPEEMELKRRQMAAYEKMANNSGAKPTAADKKQSRIDEANNFLSEFAIANPDATYSQLTTVAMNRYPDVYSNKIDQLNLETAAKGLLPNRFFRVDDKVPPTPSMLTFMPGAVPPPVDFKTLTELQNAVTSGQLDAASARKVAIDKGWAK